MRDFNVNAQAVNEWTSDVQLKLLESNKGNNNEKQPKNSDQYTIIYRIWTQGEGEERESFLSLNSLDRFFFLNTSDLFFALKLPRGPHNRFSLIH